jgi:ABC-type transporter Mla subunit MlaD
MTAEQLNKHMEELKDLIKGINEALQVAHRTCVHLDKAAGDAQIVVFETQEYDHSLSEAAATAIELTVLTECNIRNAIAALNRKVL